MTRYAIGLGSNMGDRWGHLAGALEEIGREVGRGQVSSLYETEPVGGPDQDPFLNAVVLVDTDIGAHELLETLQRIETAHGRARRERWGPRTLDLDILASDGPAISGESLTVPHPRAREREFVRRPLAEVWPEAPVGDGVTVVEALGSGEGVDFLARQWIPPIPSWKGRALVAGQFLLIIATALVLPVDGSLPNGEVTAGRILGAVMIVIGVILAFIASRRLGPAMTASPVPRPQARLVTGGPYRFARHPIYGGVSLVMMGTALVLDSLVGFGVAALLLPYFLVKAAYEERQLRMRFAGYRAYRNVVHRRLIPFVL